MTAAERRANVTHQQAWQDRRKLEGYKRMNIWVDPATAQRWAKLHPLFGGVTHAFRAAVRNLEREF